MRAHRVALPLVAVALLSGCGDRPDWITEPLQLGIPEALDHGLYYVERNRGEVLRIDVLADEGEGRQLVQRFPVGEDARQLVRIPGPDANSASRGLALLTPESKRLHLIVEDPTTGVTTTSSVDLSQEYDRVAFSPDGRAAMAWMGEAGEQSGFVTLAGKVAVIDVLAAIEGSDDAVVEQSLNLEEAPTRVVFSRPLRLFAGEETTLAAVVTSQRIALVDMGAPDRRARTIFLDPSVEPVVMRFTDGIAPEADAEYLLFNAHHDTGISAYRVLPTEAPAAGEPRLDLTFHQLLPDDRPADFHVFADPAGDHYRVVSIGEGAARATLMESLTSPVGITVELNGGHANRVVSAATPEGDEIAVLYDDRGTGTQLYYMGLDTSDGRRPEVRTGEPFVRPVTAVRLVAHHPGMALVELQGTSQLELVDLASARSTPVRLRSQPVASVWDRRGSELYLVASEGGAEGNLLVRVRLEGRELQSETLVLDYAPHNVRLLPGLGVAVVEHASAHGLLTAVPIPDMDRSKARVIEGYLLGGLLDVAAGRDDE